MIFIQKKNYSKKDVVADAIDIEVCHLTIKLGKRLFYKSNKDANKKLL